MPQSDLTVPACAHWNPFKALAKVLATQCGDEASTHALDIVLADLRIDLNEAVASGNIARARYITYELRRLFGDVLSAKSRNQINFAVSFIDAHKSADATLRTMECALPKLVCMPQT